MATAAMRGLQMFITDIRNCQTVEQEHTRVEKELEKIKVKFLYEKSISSYGKRKYAWKLLYIHLLGYQFDFGYREVLSLISATKYPSKQVGYMITACLLNENHELLKFAVKTIHLDIIGRNEACQCFALALVGNIGNAEFAEAMAHDVQKLAVSSSCRPLVKKKAVLCLLHLYRKNSQVIDPDSWPQHMANLLDEKDYGVLNAVMSLLNVLAANNPSKYYNCISKSVRILEGLIRNQLIPQDYTYYGVSHPWLQVLTMRVLYHLPLVEDPHTIKNLLELLERVLMEVDVLQSLNRINATNAILFEAITLVMKFDARKTMVPRCVSILCRFLGARDPNYHYLGLENMARMLQVADFRDSVKVHQAEIVASLRHSDASVQHRALDLLCAMCDSSNVKDIVQEILQFLSIADFAFQEDILFKVGMLVEKFTTDCSWYIDVTLQLVEKGGALVGDDVWHNLIDLVAENKEVQVYAAAQARDYIGRPTVHEKMVKVAGSLLGEFSYLIATKPGYSPKEIFSAIHDKFHNVSNSTKAVMLTAYINLLIKAEPADNELRQQVLQVFETYGASLSPEMQEKAMSYFSLSQNRPHLSEVPPSPKSQQSAVSGQTSSARPAQIDLLGDLMSFESAPDTSSSALLSLDASSTLFGKPFSVLQDAAPVQPIGSISEWFIGLCKRDTGILYEDPHLQIGVKAQWQGAQGTLSLFLGNKNTFPLTSIKGVIIPQPHLRLELMGLPENIPASTQLQCSIKVASLRAGRNVPGFDLIYAIAATTVAVKLQLPVVMSKFLMGMSLSANEFFSHWRAFAGPPNKLQEVVNGVKCASVGELTTTLNILHINVAPGLDPNPNNIVAATIFQSESVGQVLGMVRIETDPGDGTQVRLTVASSDPITASELKEYVKEEMLSASVLPLSALLTLTLSPTSINTTAPVAAAAAANSSVATVAIPSSTSSYSSSSITKPLTFDLDSLI